LQCILQQAATGFENYCFVTGVGSEEGDCPSQHNKRIYTQLLSCFP